MLDLVVAEIHLAYLATSGCSTTWRDSRQESQEEEECRLIPAQKRGKAGRAAQYIWQITTFVGYNTDSSSRTAC